MRITRKPEDGKLLYALAKTRRFGNVRLMHYADRFEPEREKQFAAVTALLDDGSAYLAYRGTDNTLVGWKEDFNMAFMPVVASQEDALDYLEKAAAALPGESDSRRPFQRGQSCGLCGGQKQPCREHPHYSRL